MKYQWNKYHKKYIHTIFLLKKFCVKDLFSVFSSLYFILKSQWMSKLIFNLFTWIFFSRTIFSYPPCLRNVFSLLFVYNYIDYFSHILIHTVLLKAWIWWYWTLIVVTATRWQILTLSVLVKRPSIPDQFVSADQNISVSGVIAIEEGNITAL